MDPWLPPEAGGNVECRQSQAGCGGERAGAGGSQPWPQIPFCRLPYAFHFCVFLGPSFLI